jgi:hypothetical protein
MSFRAAGRFGLTATVVLGLVAGATVSAHAAPPSHGKRAYFAQAFAASAPAYRPKTLIASGDGSFSIRHMHWASWTTKHARGHGTAFADNCQPSCATGHYRKDAVHVVLVKPRSVCGGRFFARMRLHYTARNFPSSIDRHQRYDIRPNCFNARPATATPKATQVLSCQRRVSTRPTNDVMSCANAGAAWLGVTWTHWGGSAAKGAGKVLLNACTPKCASGHFHRYAAKIVLSKVRHEPSYGRVFSHAVVTYSVNGKKTQAGYGLLGGLRLAKASGGTGEFLSPISGIGCELDNSPGFRRTYCQRVKAGTPNVSVTMAPNGSLDRCSGTTCAGDAGEGTPTLQYGKSRKAGAFRCLSSRSGIVCTVKRGSGFLISLGGITRVRGY